MIATAHAQPQPPHLLASSNMPYAADMTSQHGRPARQTHRPQLSNPILQPVITPEPTTGRIKGLFSRNRVTSPEPDPTIRSRLRSFIGESKAGPSRQPSATTSTTRSTKDKAATPSREHTKRGLTKGREIGSRPGSPEATRRTAIRFGPSLLPAIQKGSDGKWQPPSLSRGSLSTSALALYADEEAMEDQPRVAVGKGDKKSLAVLFNSKSQKEVNREKSVRSPPPGSRPPAPPPKSSREEIGRTVMSGNGSGFSFQEISPVKATQDRTVRSPVRRSIDATEDATVRPARTSLDSPTRQLPPRQPFAKAAQSVPNSPTAPASRHQSSRSASSTPQPPLGMLSKDHYHLRLATSYLIRVLTPFIRGSGFASNEKMFEMKRKADEHISALGRMEKGWGGDWAKAAGNVGKGDQEELADGANEKKVRAVSVSERAKERERRVWVDVMRDGILLCLLLNQLFPASPQHIARVNITEDGILRATNLTRFTTACQTVGLPEAEIFGLADLQEGSEAGMGQVAITVISLARLAGRSKAAVRSRSPTAASSARTPAQSRSPSRAAASTTTANGSPRPRATSPRAASPVPIPSRDGMPNKPDALDRSGAAEMSNDLHAKLEIDVAKAKKVPDLDDPAYRTPTASAFVDSAEEAPRRAPLPRSTTQPNLSPNLRPRSPPAISPSRSNTPIARPLASSGRPTLRPRYTTGSKVSVSFAPRSDLPLSPRSAASDRSSIPSAGYGGHSRERTPSLISSGSRVTSGYTRSSAAYSVSTVLGDDHAIEIAEDDGDNPTSTRLRERRMSEKTLHNARQKILGTLLSSDDLPEDLRRALEREAEEMPEDPRNQAISQSLAALEGWKAPNRPDSSPRRTPARPISRCGDVMRVAEEDEVSSNGGSSIEGIKPSIVRRSSANGKVLIPKRSASPSQKDGSSGSPVRPKPFPASNLSTGSGASAELPRRPVPGDRRQSDGISYANSGTGSDGMSDRPNMSARNNSMVNLGGASGTSSSIFRESLLRASHSQPLQILEINEPGFPPVKYQVGNCVGRGQFGAVYRSLNLSSGQMVAIKRIKLNGMKLEEVDDVMHEVELLKKLSHPSIVRYEGMSRDDEYLNIVLEYIENGSLVQTLKSFGRFNEQLISSYVARILEGLDYLHSQGVVHCDLKAANILSTKNGNVKLSDFGVSLTMKAVENLQTQTGGTANAGRSKEDKRKSNGMETVQGSPNWMAPEVINLQGATTASDIWSLGCTVVELLTGQPPYSDLPNSMAVLWHIVMDTEPPIPSGISGDLRDFLELCFIKDPEKRPAAVVLFEHPWIKKLNPDLALRPQDSVPFLRRVSMDLRRIDSTRLFSSDMSNGAPSASRAPSYADISEAGAGKRNRYSFASSHGREASDGPVRDHELIKTTFGKAILCRICHASVKKGGVLCQHCGLICHTACVSKAPKRCDITEQLALLARQQDFLAQHPHLGFSAASSRRQSFDDESDPSGHGHGAGHGHFTALPVKILHGLKRNKSAMSSAVDLAYLGKRRSSGGLGRSPGGLERPSLDAPQRDSMSGSNSHGRASVFTEGSGIGSEESAGGSAGGGDIKRRSVIRFQLADEGFGGDGGAVREVGVGDGGEVRKRDGGLGGGLGGGGDGGDGGRGKMGGGVEVVVERMEKPKKGHKRDNKSDCVIM